MLIHASYLNTIGVAIQVGCIDKNGCPLDIHPGWLLAPNISHSWDERDEFHGVKIAGRRAYAGGCNRIQLLDWWG